jgi:hypothetical protein
MAVSSTHVPTTQLPASSEPAAAAAGRFPEDPLAPARGILLALVLSVGLWVGGLWGLLQLR